MELVEAESWSGYYNVYLHDNGKKYVVLRGLDPDDVHTPGAIESYISHRYEAIAISYWIILVCLFAFLIWKYLATPLYQRLGSFKFKGE